MVFVSGPCDQDGQQGMFHGLALFQDASQVILTAYDYLLLACFQSNNPRIEEVDHGELDSGASGLDRPTMDGVALQSG